MSFERGVQELRTAEAKYRDEIEGLKNRVRELSGELHAAKVKTQDAQEAREKERLKRDQSDHRAAQLEGEVVKAKTAVAAELATLRAEKETLSNRDREAREELERLRMSKMMKKVDSKMVMP